MRPISLCVPPRRGELCAPVRLELRGEHTSVELTARHRVTGVELDERTGRVAVLVEITDPATARPVHVRFSVLPLDAEVSGRAVKLAEIDRDGQRLAVYGTYQGVVSEEN